jgi:2-keto-4-pentenoate hydratase/2-oxohepta-3-ene-1,7-dioic acid hydratase in catechol pathway
LTAKVNGVEWSRGNTKDMHWSFEEIIAYISQSETLYPGEIIASGTCSGEEGMGCGLELGKFINSGDVVVCTAEELGTLKNHIL